MLRQFFRAFTIILLPFLRYRGSIKAIPISATYTCSTCSPRENYPHCNTDTPRMRRRHTPDCNTRWQTRVIRIELELSSMPSAEAPTERHSQREIVGTLGVQLARISPQRSGSSPLKNAPNMKWLRVQTVHFPDICRCQDFNDQQVFNCIITTIKL